MPVLPRLMISIVLILGACGELDGIGQEPEFTPIAGTLEQAAMINSRDQYQAEAAMTSPTPSLWRKGRSSLFGDRRANTSGDILTVVIEIDDSARISNTTSRSRTGGASASIGSLFGLPELLEPVLPGPVTLSQGSQLNGNSNFDGDGSIQRNEQLTLRVAATVLNVLQNGTLEIRGTQEIRVNYELRELVVTGYVRPEDISRMNEITYDKIAAARISYGGRGLISSSQKPTIGQQVVDSLIPF